MAIPGAAHVAYPTKLSADQMGLLYQSNTLTSAKDFQLENLIIMLF